MVLGVRIPRMLIYGFYVRGRILAALNVCHTHAILLAEFSPACVCLAVLGVISAKGQGLKVSKDAPLARRCAVPVPPRFSLDSCRSEILIEMLRATGVAESELFGRSKISLPLAWGMIYRHVSADTCLIPLRTLLVSSFGSNNSYVSSHSGEGSTATAQTAAQRQCTSSSPHVSDLIGKNPGR